MATAPPRTRAEKPEPSWELVLKRNPVERLKRDKDPLGIRDELPTLIAAGYEAVPEEDIVRLQWWGLYHDKPKIGRFMLRIKLPSGQISPAKLRAIADVSERYGRGDAELATRQNVQLHWLELASLPDVFAALDEAGLSTAGGCGDTVRNITGCPLEGLAHDELFDCSEIVADAAAFFYGNPDYTDLPRKHKITISACAHACNAPEINCIALVGAIVDGREGFTVRVGGGLSSVPRISRDMGVFVPKEQAIPVLRAILDAWKTDLRYRVSRVKARLKFMIDDIGADGMRERVEALLGERLEDYEAPPLPPPADHMGIQAQKQPGLVSIGVPVHLGITNSAQLRGVADLAADLAADVRLTRQQNLIVADVPSERIDEAVRRLQEIGFSLRLNPLRAKGVACTGEPHCNFSVTETKSRLGRLIEHLEDRFGEALGGLGLQLDGCPHSCAQHWIADLGFQGTTARDADGKRRQAYDIFVRGGLGPGAQIGRPLFRRVVSEELDAAVEGLVQGWLVGRAEGEGFAEFSRRLTDEDLGVLAGVAPARGRDREEETA
jgi:ferredoxin-nitrite reductase